jgi:hypothetical protein
VVRQPKLIVPADSGAHDRDRSDRSSQGTGLGARIMRPLGPIEPRNRTRSTDHETPRAAPGERAVAARSPSRAGARGGRVLPYVVVVFLDTTCKTKFPGLGNRTLFPVTNLKDLISGQMFPFF